MNKILTLILFVSSLLLSGCAGALRPISEHITATDESWAKSQKHANVQAVVIQDEEYSTMLMGALENAAGVGPQERKFRHAVLYMVNSEGGKPFLGFKGGLRFTAIVPDGMSILKQGDLVEARFGSVYDNLKGFAVTGEGTAVLRLLCPTTTSRSQSDAFKACAEVLPWKQEWGEGLRCWDGVLAMPTGRPYAASLKDYPELSFSPYYDGEGKPLTNIIQPGSRPSILNWPTPTRY